jgi:hypothetical protein
MPKKKQNEPRILTTVACVYCPHHSEGIEMGGDSESPMLKRAIYCGHPLVNVGAKTVRECFDYPEFHDYAEDSEIAEVPIPDWCPLPKLVEP